MPNEFRSVLILFDIIRYIKLTPWRRCTSLLAVQHRLHATVVPKIFARCACKWRIYLTHTWRTDSKKQITSERLSNLCSDTAASNNFLNQRPRRPENHFSLWLFLIQLYNLLSFSLYRASVLIRLPIMNSNLTAFRSNSFTSEILHLLDNAIKKHERSQATRHESI